MTDLSFLDDGLQPEEMAQAAKALAELEKELARTDIPADSEAMEKIRANLAWLQQQVSAAGQDMEALRKLAEEQQAAGRALQRDRPTDEEIEAAEQAVDAARTALADGTGTRADLDAAVKKVAELKRKRAEADGRYSDATQGIRVKVDETAEQAGGRPSTMPNETAGSGSVKPTDTTSGSGQGQGKQQDNNQLAQLLAAASQQQQGQQQPAQQASMPQVSMPTTQQQPTTAQQQGAVAPAGLSAADIQKLLRGEGGSGSGTRESSDKTGPKATSPTKFRPNFSATPGAGETRPSRDTTLPVTATSVHTNSDVSGRSQPTPGAFHTSSAGTQQTTGGGASSASGTPRGGMPMMPPMMPPMGGAAGGGGKRAEAEAIVDRSGRVHGEDVREAAVENGSIVNRISKGGGR